MILDHKKLLPRLDHVGNSRLKLMQALARAYMAGEIDKDGLRWYFSRSVPGRRDSALHKQRTLRLAEQVIRIAHHLPIK